MPNLKLMRLPESELGLISKQLPSPVDKLKQSDAKVTQKWGKSSQSKANTSV